MSGRQLTLLSLLVISGIVVVGQLYGAIPLTGGIAAELGATSRDAAWVSSVFGFGYAPGFLLFGSVTDRIGCRKTAVFGLFLLAIATTLVAVAPTFGTLLLARFAQGVCASSFAPAALALVAEAFPPRDRPVGLSLVSFSFLAAAPAAQFGAVRIGEPLSILMLWTVPVYVVCGVAVAVACPSILPFRSAKSSGWASAGTLASDPGIIGTWMAAATVLFCLCGVPVLSSESCGCRWDQRAAVAACWIVRVARSARCRDYYSEVRRAENGDVGCINGCRRFPLFDRASDRGPDRGLCAY